MYVKYGHSFILLQGSKYTVVSEAQGRPSCTQCSQGRNRPLTSTFVFPPKHKNHEAVLVHTLNNYGES